ncbi:MAG: hypothetical protein MZV70_12100 [Desulfobacterales bacterium]|nr:hypothetical protein [Desulfobacterales bacterium]
MNCGSVPSALRRRSAQLSFDRQFGTHAHYRSLYTKRESLERKAEQPDTSVVLAIADSTHIVGFGVLAYPDPEERWAAAAAEAHDGGQRDRSEPRSGVRRKWREGHRPDDEWCTRRSRTKSPTSSAIPGPGTSTATG